MAATPSLFRQWGEDVIWALPLAITLPPPKLGPMIHAVSFCVGGAWVKLLPGEHAYPALGPIDANFVYVKRADHKHWTDGAGRELGGSKDIDGVLFDRGELAAWHFINHLGEHSYMFSYNYDAQTLLFDGTVFNGRRSDKKFFDRVAFGMTAKARCKSETVKM